MTPEQALARLLSGTSVAYRRTSDGVFVLYVQPAVPMAVAEPPVPEILVIGRRSQNTDIRRTENDIQPYVVSTGAEIVNSHSDDVGAFFRSRIPPEASLTTNAQVTAGDAGFVNSAINLRGLGTVRTLVLVDGRRMPSVPTAQFDFGQADLNAIPLSSIERVETLTGSAGGIYGPGAIGGVVNIVLRRDYRGADIHLVTGISSRGDARRLGVEARVGFTPDDGRTDVMIFGSHTTIEPVLQSHRDYRERAWRRRYQNNPAGFIAQPTLTNAIGVFSQSGNLTFDPQFGGQNLGSPITFVPLDFTGSAPEVRDLLMSNAGRLVFEPPHEEDQLFKDYLLSNPTITSGILNVRHRFNDHLQGFADLLYFRDDGRFEGNLQTTVVTQANAPNNPFQQPVRFTFPGIGFGNSFKTRLQSRRLTVGLISDIGTWRGSADFSLGRASVAVRQESSFSGLPFLIALILGSPGPDGQLLVDPLAGWDQLKDLASSMVELSSTHSKQVTRSGAASVRLAGPVADLGAGPINLSLVGERRWEHSPERQVVFSESEFNYPLPIRRQSITSAYGEVRVPVELQDAKTILRGLELQLAARYDRVKTTLPENTTATLPTNDRLISVDHDSLTFTAGGRVFPSAALMLRASVATGELPPSIRQLSIDRRLYGSSGELGSADPRRGGRRIGSEGDATVAFAGSHNLEAERARTITIGAVLNPNGGHRPRLSIDYSRIDARRAVSFFPHTLNEVLADEDRFSARIVRAPLSDSDRVLGFTAGRIVSIDLTASNEGSTRVETVDANLDWTLSLGRRGDLRIYSSATWYPSFTIKEGAGEPWRSRLKYINGPVRWRGNAGIDYTKGPLLVGLNVQHVNEYSPVFFDDFQNTNSTILANQGSNRIPSQTYVDLTVRRKFKLRDAGKLKSLDLNLGILNLFDRSPPIITQNLLPGYSYYGDPRRRRFELVVSADF